METNDISSALSKLLEDPAALANAMSIASSLMGGMPSVPASAPPDEKQPSEAEAQANEAVSASTTPAQSDALGDVPSVAAIANLLGGGAKNDPRCALLYALKPYMGHGRAEKIDTLVNMLRLADLAGGMLGGKLF